ncbi:MAG TPA: FAD-binding oxidoreductase, partial [Nocardioidaceae bacterium]|nr:FAD-binding oxidoreductase [Nocardioidaceae bacterium]
PEGECHVQVTLKGEGETPEAPSPARSSARLRERRLLTTDTALFVFVLDQPIDYWPGQFVKLEFPDGVRRAYSMTRPQRSEHRYVVELLIRAKPGGEASTWLFDQLTVGDGLVVEGPYGRAYAQSHRSSPVVCIAGGTGVAPVMAIADRLSSESPGRRLDVYVGARTYDDLVLADRLVTLKGRGANVVVSVDQGVDRHHQLLGPVRSGMALDHLVNDVPDLRDHDVYLAGPTPMIDAALRRLVREGTACADRVFMDRFS